MTKPITDEELRANYLKMFRGGMEPLFKVLGSNDADFDRLIQALANASVVVAKDYAEMVIGEDNWSNVPGTISTANQTIKKDTYIHIRNQLRAEQRERMQ